MVGLLLCHLECHAVEAPYKSCQGHLRPIWHGPWLQSTDACYGVGVSRKGFESDAHIRQFLARGSSSRASKADEAGPSQLDIRDLRSLSLSMPSFSVLGPPIGVSLPDSDLKDLRVLVGAGSSVTTPLKVRFPLQPLAASSDADDTNLSLADLTLEYDSTC